MGVAVGVGVVVDVGKAVGSGVGVEGSSGSEGALTVADDRLSASIVEAAVAVPVASIGGVSTAVSVILTGTSETASGTAARVDGRQPIKNPPRTIKPVANER